MKFSNTFKNILENSLTETLWDVIGHWNGWVVGVENDLSVQPELSILGTEWFIDVEKFLGGGWWMVGGVGGGGWWWWCW